MSNQDPFAVTIPSKAVADLFVEMVGKTAVAAPNAKNLAYLYTQAESVAEHYGIKLPLSPP